MRLRLLLCTLVLALASCRRPSPEHTWYRPSPRSIEAAPLPPQLVYRVPVGRTTAAIRALRDRQWLLLTPASCRAWLGPHVIPPPDTTPYLVRAVERFPSSHFDVRQAHGVLFVHSRAMGHSTPPTVPQPLIVFLTEAPTDLFVSSTVAD